MVDRKPTVRFECEDCAWTCDIRDEHIVFDDGIPRSTVVPFHTCEGGGHLLERSGFDAELYTTAPMQHWTMKL